MKYLYKTKQLIKTSVDKFDNALSIIAIALMFAFTFSLISLSLAQISTEIGSPSYFKAPSDWLLQSVGIDTTKITETKYTSLLGTITSVIAVVVTLYFSILTTLSHIKTKIKINRESIIKKYDTPNDGTDDLLIMLRYYKKAEHLTIFAGDYDWLEKNTELKTTILSLAARNKLKLVSHKTETSVESSMQPITFSSLKKHFTFDSKFNKKCSVIKASQENVLLYKFDTSIRVGGAKQIYVIHEVDDTKYLLKVIEKFAEAI